MIRLTFFPAAARGRGKVHTLQGGGPGTLDAEGRPRYLAGVTWCGLHRRAGVHLVETDRPVTCRTCLRILAARERGAK